MGDFVTIETDGGAVATLYYGDCLEVLPQVCGVDLVVSDVPYKLTSGGSGSVETDHVTMKGMFGREAYVNDGEIIPCPLEFSDWMGPVIRACAESAEAYLMVNDRNLKGLQDAAAHAGWEHHNLLVWGKGTKTPNRWYMKSAEFTLYLFKGRARVINNCSSEQISYHTNPRNKFHPTEKPVALMADYIGNSTDLGGLVMDPFMGSGSTGVAALQLGRNFVGMEIDRGYFEVACQRLEAAARRADLSRPAGGAGDGGLFDLPMVKGVA